MTLQQVDPEVSRRKFDQEISDFRSLTDQYRKRGWFLVEATFPKASIVLATTKTVPPALVMGVEFDYTDYDAFPPSVRIVNPLTGVPLKARELPTQMNRSVPGQEMPMPVVPAGPGIVIPPKIMMEVLQPYLQSYSPDEIPFLCLPGVREYHEHPAHSGDAWELHRTAGAGRLVRLLDVIYQYGIAPIAGFDVQLVPQVRLRYGPAPK